MLPDSMGDQLLLSMDHAAGKKGTRLGKLILAEHTRRQQEQAAPWAFISALGAEVSRTYLVLKVLMPTSSFG